MQPSFSPGTLRCLALGASARALTTGALRPNDTRVEQVAQSGVRFLVHVLAGATGGAPAQLKQQQSALAAGGERDPFLPYEEDLFVADISATHVCLLNKFPVIPNHLLIITRAYEEQDAPLTPEDFAALWACMDEMEGLAFYNSGRVSGASQRHKHLQIAPLPLERNGPRLPVAPLIDRLPPGPAPAQVPEFPFRHALGWLPPARLGAPEVAAAAMMELHRHLLQATGVWRGQDVAPAPHNWLATREWLLVVPRSRERAGGIGVNALGFAGSLLVRSAKQLAWLRAQGPLDFLRLVVEE